MKFCIRSDLDIVTARLALRELAPRRGFCQRSTSELALVATELGTNILRHAGTGELSFAPHHCEEHGPGLVLLASDEGPAFVDFDTALQDGCDDKGPIDPALRIRRGGPGTGLGTVSRLVHELTLETDAPSGKTLRAVRYVTPPRRWPRSR